MRPFLRVSLPVVLSFVGCAQSTWFGKEYMPLAQVKTVLATEKDKDPLLGRITPTGETVPGYSTAQAANKGYDLKWEDVQNGRLCVTTEAKSWYKDGENRAEQYDREHIENGFGADTMVVEAKKSLDDITEATQWPSSTPKGSIDKVEAKVVKRTHSDRASGLSGSAGIEPGYKVVYEVRWCGPAPGIAADTRYVVITRYLSRSTGVAPSYFIWAVDREPGSTPATDAKGEPSTPQHQRRRADSAEAREPADPAAATDDLLVTASRDGRFTTFLDLLATSTFRDKLKSGDYTLFIPTDAALAKIPDEVKKWRKDKKLLEQVMQTHIVGGKRTPKAIRDGVSSADGFGKLQNQLGDYLEVRPDHDTFRIAKRATVVMPPIDASNGLIYAIDASLQ